MQKRARTTSFIGLAVFFLGSSAWEAESRADWLPDRDGTLFAVDGRAAFGIGFPFDAEKYVNLAMDGAVTFRIGLEEWVEGEWVSILMPEIGYTGIIETSKTPEGGQSTGVEGHFAVTGVGFGGFYEGMVFGVVPGVMIGGQEDEQGDVHLAWGVRALFTAELIYIFGVQASLQFVQYGNEFIPEFQVMGSLNLLPIIVAGYIVGH